MTDDTQNDETCISDQSSYPSPAYDLAPRSVSLNGTEYSGLELGFASNASVDEVTIEFTTTNTTATFSVTQNRESVPTSSQTQGDSILYSFTVHSSDDNDSPWNVYFKNESSSAAGDTGRDPRTPVFTVTKKENCPTTR